MRNKTIFKICTFWVLCYALYWCSVEFLILPYLHPAGIRAKTKAHYNENFIPKDEVDYLVLGDSSSLYSINPLELSPRSYSAAELGASVARSRQLLQELKIKKIKKGIILGQTFIDPHYNEDIWKIFIPQRMLSMNGTVQIFCGNENANCTFLEKFKYRLMYVWYRAHINAHIGSIFSYAIREQIFFKWKVYSSYVRDTIRESQGHFPAKRTQRLTNAEFFLSYRKFFRVPIDPPEYERYELLELKKIAESYGVKLFLIKPYFFKKVPVDLTQYESSYDNFLRPLKESGIIFIDEEMKVDLDRNHYRDFNHLNQDGAVLYSRELKNVLESFTAGERL